MSRWGTWLLLVLALAAGIFVFVVEPRLTSSREKELGMNFVLNFNPGAVSSVRIVTGDVVVELTRKVDGWRVGPMPKDRASAEAVIKLVNALATLKVLDRVEAAEFDRGLELDDFGLDETKSEIEILIDGAERQRLLFGKEAVGDGRVYVRRADSREVSVVSDDVVGLAFRPAREFRDPALMSISPAEIDRFVVRTEKGEIKLERGARGWELIRPLRARADRERVEAFLTPILRARIQEFIADESDDLSAFGLSEPRAELIFYVNGQKRPLALRFGAATDDGAAVIVQSTARDSVYELPAVVWEHLQVTPGDLRDRRLTDVNLDTIDRIRVEGDDTKRELTRTETGWEMDGETFSEADIAQRVAWLTEAEVLDYLPASSAELEKQGFSSPVGEIHFDAWLSENTPESRSGRYPVQRVVVGKVAGDRAFLRVNEDPEIAVVDAKAVGWFF
ncbi:MAG: DUF4340 domain-containing protein [Chthoniobacterales bacterium]